MSLLAAEEECGCDSEFKENRSRPKVTSVKDPNPTLHKVKNRKAQSEKKVPLMLRNLRRRGRSEETASRRDTNSRSQTRVPTHRTIAQEQPEVPDSCVLSCVLHGPPASASVASSDPRSALDTSRC